MVTRRTFLRALMGISALAAIHPNAVGGSDLLQRFQSRYRSMQSIRCTFTTTTGLKGTIVAKRGGAYAVALPDRTIVSNGTTVWSASPSARTVIINTYKAQSNDVSLEKVFFDIMSIYRGQVMESKGAGGTIRLTPPDAHTVIAGVTRVDIALDASTLVTGLLLTENGTTESYTIASVTLNPKIKASTFTYSPPKGWEVIDLR